MDILKPGTGFMEVLEVECVKNEPVWESSLSEYAPLEDLYADHKVKQELVIVKIENGETSEEGLRNCNCKDTALPSVAINKVKHNLSQKDLFQVQNCFVKIQRMILHKEHLKNCDINKPHKCEVCRKQFKIKSQLINHERTHTGEKPYSCSICSRAFSELSNLRKHERSHTGERPFSCKICKRRFAMKCNLLDHIRTHTKERPYSCNFCFNQFRDFTTFTRHKLTHTKDKQFTCDICNHQFTRKYRLINHIHNHSAKKKYACEICSKQFEKKCNLKAHEKQHKENYLCEICDKQFSQIFALKRHLLSHMAVPALGRKERQVSESAEIRPTLFAGGVGDRRTTSRSPNARSVVIPRRSSDLTTGQ
ncbi:hypothetical protein MSG28_007568 [Choristoneura fumiferana]|uniref:Uncharacterized protein n=1 Tax=Choristoneura fumiferana TaxID=7141 RepID=A0ACC0JY59_CHOFU|nr:hypothetical protein MSG28_007568 [Choristoneura fumiferana]